MQNRGVQNGGGVALLSPPEMSCVSAQRWAGEGGPRWRFFLEVGDWPIATKELLNMGDPRPGRDSCGVRCQGGDPGCHRDCLADATRQEGSGRLIRKSMAKINRRLLPDN